MEIQINVLNEMKKLRTSTYTDQYTWIDELIQNAQRAKASKIKMTTLGYSKVIVEDDGCGCTDPSVLFRKSDTGWTDDVVQSESPFGEGFFSTMMAADHIEVDSVGFHAIFDVKKMFETGDIDCIEITPNNRKKGFTVELTDLRSNYSLYSAQERFKTTMKFIKNPVGYLKPSEYTDEYKIEYEGLEPVDKDEYTIKFNNDMFTGWMQPYSWRNHQWDDGKLRCFAYNRFVKDLNNHDCVRGVINLRSNAVTLRSPDRKDIIDNEQYQKFMEKIEKAIKNTMINVMKFGDDSMVANFSSYITRYVPMHECKKYLKFKLYGTDETIGGDDTDDPDAYFASLDDPAQITPDYNERPDDAPDAIQTLTDSDTSKNYDVNVQNASSMNQKPQPQKAPKPVIASKMTGTSIDNIKYGFYVESANINTFKEELGVAEYYHIPVITTRNELELKYIEEQMPHILPLSQLNSYMSINGSYTGTKPKNEDEKRIVNILNSIGLKIANRNDMFSVANVKMYKVLNAGDKQFNVSEIDSFAVAYNDHIYINRANMKTYGVVFDHSTKSLTDMDKRFVLTNLDTIAHEMAHVIYSTDDNTKEHFERQSELMQKIIYTLYD